MARRIVPLLGTLAAAVSVGLLAAMIYLQANSSPAASPKPSISATDDPSPVGAILSDRSDTYIGRLQNLEAQLHEYRQHGIELESKIEQLSSRLEALNPAVSVAGLIGNESSAGESNTADALETQTAILPLTVSTLVDAGVDEQLAAEIVRREGEREMQRLELRDQAIRDGTFATEAYFESQRALSQDTRALREEVGDSAYDRYLYATNRSNRVLISSVIPGSPAEQAGIQAGDMILGYADKRIFSWSELREATTQGDRSEYVQVNIQRDSAPISLLLPRGPLGVRMDSTREPPANN